MVKNNIALAALSGVFSRPWRSGFSPKPPSNRRYERAISGSKASRVGGLWSSSKSWWKVQFSCPENNLKKFPKLVTRLAALVQVNKQILSLEILTHCVSILTLENDKNFLKLFFVLFYFLFFNWFCIAVNERICDWLFILWLVNSNGFLEFVINEH